MKAINKLFKKWNLEADLFLEKAILKEVAIF